MPSSLLCLPGRTCHTQGWKKAIDKLPKITLACIRKTFAFHTDQSYNVIYLFYVYGCLAGINVYALCVWSYRGQKRTSNPLEQKGCELPPECRELNLGPLKSSQCSFVLSPLSRSHTGFLKLYRSCGDFESVFCDRMPFELIIQYCFLSREHGSG